MARSSIFRKQRNQVKALGRFWGDWTAVDVTEEMKVSNPLLRFASNVFTNNRYQVDVFPFACPGIGGIQQLCVTRHMDVEEITWDELQRIKAELFGDDVTAIEQFPAEHLSWKIQRKVRVLWILPRDYVLPFGLHFEEAWGGATMQPASQEPSSPAGEQPLSVPSEDGPDTVDHSDGQSRATDTQPEDLSR